MIEGEIGRYRVIETIGRGSLAEVYRVFDERLQREVLLHMLAVDDPTDETARTTFLAKIQECARCSHPALLDVFDSGEMDGRPYMVSEYIPERALYGMGMLPVGQALQAISQVAEVILICRERGITPPPVSSRNVWRIHERQVKLVENWLLSQEEATLDQACYRAPELAPDAPQTPASLVYALGLLLYELLTGIRPAAADRLETIALAHQQLRILPLIQVRPTLYLPTLERLISHATASLPEERWSSIRGFIEELDRVRRHVESSTNRLPVALSARHQQRIQQEKASTAPSPPLPAPSVPAGPSWPLTALPEREAGMAQSDPLAVVVDPDKLPRKPLLKQLLGWFVTLLLLLIVAYVSYLLASYAVDQLFAIKLPRPQMPGIVRWVTDWWPESSPGPAMTVNITEGLNLRDQPGVSSTIIATIRHGAKVYQLTEPQVVDHVEWVRVQARSADIQEGRVESGKKTIEGWMSRSFLIPETP